MYINKHNKHKNKENESKKLKYISFSNKKYQNANPPVIRNNKKIKNINKKNISNEKKNSANNLLYYKNKGEILQSSIITTSFFSYSPLSKLV